MHEPKVDVHTLPQLFSVPQGAYIIRTIADVDQKLPTTAPDMQATHTTYVQSFGVP